MPIDPENSNLDEGADQIPEEIKPENPRQAPVLGKSQKIAVAALAVFALLIIVLWMVKLKKDFSQPFTYKEPDNSATENSAGCSGKDCPAVQEALKNKDTDADGLNDYDEPYVYLTSAYLADSDSDGIADGAEVKAGTNPNCPEGKKCEEELLTGKQSDTQSSDASELQDEQLQLLLNLMEEGAGEQNSGSSGSENTLTQEQLDLIAGQMDAATLRQLLIANGMEKATLDKISDEELMKSFNESVKSAN